VKRINEYTTGTADERPWGRWIVLATGDGFAVKEITVEPGEALSLQSHEHRAEHWIILAGEGEVTVDDNIDTRGPGDTAFIPVGARHRVASTGDSPLRFIEVQTGGYLSENDIQRYDDRYGRVK
jgi:mannose-1-phosphate guanylyltransferase/mannose-1-phosphate guanylyltransferase/mannose-6-phosphate isomerase